MIGRLAAVLALAALLGACTTEELKASGAATFKNWCRNQDNCTVRGEQP